MELTGGAASRAMGGDEKSGGMWEESGSGCSVRVERLVRPDGVHFKNAYSTHSVDLPIGSQLKLVTQGVGIVPAEWRLKMSTKNKNRKNFHHKAIIEGSVEQVFSLLCPIREYEWIDGWSCNLLYSESGIVEKGAVFTTAYRPEGDSIWVVSRYEPNVVIEFVILFPGSHVLTLEIALNQLENCTEVHWTGEFTSLIDHNEFFNGISQVWFDECQTPFDLALNHYCRTGTMLKK